MAETSDETGGKGTSIAAMAIGLVLASAVAAGGGTYLGWSVLAKPPVAAKPADGKAPSRYADGSRVRGLAPITTNLAGTPAAWIRLEASVLLQADVADEDAEKLTALINEDTIAYLRTLNVLQIQGASGFQNLREDLDERVRIRSEGAVKEMIIQSLIVE
jgi:flagellar FliL protein